MFFALLSSLCAPYPPPHPGPLPAKSIVRSSLGLACCALERPPWAGRRLRPRAAPTDSAWPGVGWLCPPSPHLNASPSRGALLLGSRGRGVHAPTLPGRKPRPCSAPFIYAVALCTFAGTNECPYTSLATWKGEVVVFPHHRRWGGGGAGTSPLDTPESAGRSYDPPQPSSWGEGSGLPNPVPPPPELSALPHPMVSLGVGRRGGPEGLSVKRPLCPGSASALSAACAR